MRSMESTRQMRLACHACRNRKVKCSREFPGCRNCRNCGQPCIYPSAALKPGPKRGSIHKRRRHEQWETLPESTPRPAVAQIEVPGNQPPSSATTSPRSTGGSEEESQVYSEHIQAVAELCQPSDEHRSGRWSEPYGSLTYRNEDILSVACHDLRVSRDRMEQM